MLNLITNKEKEMMISYIEHYAFGDNAASRKPLADFNHIFRFWEKNKSDYLFQLFGGKLILEKEITEPQSIGELRAEIASILYTSKGETKKEIIDFIKKFQEKNIDLYGTTNDLNIIEVYWSIRDLYSAEALAENKYLGKTIKFISAATGKEIKIQKGCKAIRMIGKLAKDMGVDGFEEFAAAMSVIITKKDIKGKFCLSIHPFDYMTMSDNHSNWSSCMSWIENGSYRQGTVEMMNSPMVVVAYFKSDKDNFIPMSDRPEDKWNNKKWRELFVVTPEIITNIKSYPYQNDNFTLMALNWLKELADNIKLSSYEDEVKKWHYEDGMEDFIIEFSTDAMYNDFEANERLLSYFAKDVDIINFCYSGEHECMCTGDTTASFDDWTGDLVSDNAYNYKVCEHCGRKHFSHDFTNFRGRDYCRNCYLLLPEDAITGEIITKEESMKVVVAYPDDFPIKDRKVEFDTFGYRSKPIDKEDIGKTYIGMRLMNKFIHKNTTSKDFELYYGVPLHRKENAKGEAYAVVYLNEVTKRFYSIVNPYHNNKEEFLNYATEYYEKYL